jgi:hypothetical protein
MITTELQNAEYHKYAAISKTGLDKIDRSAAHFMFGEKREPSRHMVIGTAIHTAVFEPARYADDYMTLKEVKVRTASEYKQAVKARGDETTLTGPEGDFVAGMQESVQQNREASAILQAPGRAELSVITTDPQTGVAVKCRFDWLTDDGRALDLKKTQDCRMDAFGRSIANYRYHVQAAFYSDVWLWETGETLQWFKFLAVEERLPHASKIWQLPEPEMDFGRAEYRKNLDEYARCLDANDWPMPDSSSEYICLPVWAMPENDDEFTFDGDK